MVIMENRSFGQIVGNPSAPFINSLVNDVSTATMTQSHGLTHPSQPNYIMLFSGSSQGVTTNNLPAPLPFSTINLGSSLIQSGKSFIGYSEDLPSVGYTGEVYGSYARKHNPWVNWQGTGLNGIPAISNKPFSDFPSDYSQLPAFSIVVPNQNNDMHDGTIATGDAWLQSHLAGYIQWCRQHNSLFILTFDEDDGSSNNRILTLFTGANVQGGNYAQTITHYNVLRTLEELYQLPYAGASNDSTAIQDIWFTPLPVQLHQFDGMLHQDEIQLNWNTSDEQNIREYILEKCGNGQSWTFLSRITPAGTSSGVYHFTDHNPFPGANFYRLRIIEYNDHVSFSKSIIVRYKGENSFRVFPNPVSHQITIDRLAAPSGVVKVSVTDLSGRIFLQSFTSVLNARIKLDLRLAGGMYILCIDNGVSTMNQKILIKD